MGILISRLLVTSLDTKDTSPVTFMPQNRPKGKGSEMKGFWLVLLCNQPPRKHWDSVYTCPWSLRWKTFTPGPCMDVGEAEPLSFSIFSLGEIDCLLWRRVAFLGRKPMFPELFICYLFFQDFICYRNSNALGHWLKNTHIISSEKTSMQALKDSVFFPRFAAMPLISLLSQSREGQGSFRKQRERMQKKSLLIHVHGMAN